MSDYTQDWLDGLDDDDRKAVQALFAHPGDNEDGELFDYGASWAKSLSDDQTNDALQSLADAVGNLVLLDHLTEKQRSTCVGAAIEFAIDNEMVPEDWARIDDMASYSPGEIREAFDLLAVGKIGMATEILRASLPHAELASLEKTREHVRARNAGAMRIKRNPDGAMVTDHAGDPVWISAFEPANDNRLSA